MEGSQKVSIRHGDIHAVFTLNADGTISINVYGKNDKLARVSLPLGGNADAIVEAS